MCVSPETTHFPVDSLDGCICQMIEAGKEVSIPLAGYEIRDEGEKIVFLNHDGEVTVRIAYSEDVAWYSLGSPVKIVLPSGDKILCNTYTPTFQ